MTPTVSNKQYLEMLIKTNQDLKSELEKVKSEQFKLADVHLAAHIVTANERDRYKAALEKLEERAQLPRLISSSEWVSSICKEALNK